MASEYNRQRTLFATIEAYVDTPTHREYVIRSLIDGISYSVQRRFSEFLFLHDSLMAEWLTTNAYCNSMERDCRGSVLPVAFPVPRLWVHSTHGLDERFKGLQLYLRGVLGSLDAERSDLPCARLYDFLGVPRVAPAAQISTAPPGTPRLSITD